MRFLSNAPFEWFSLAMYPSGQIFLRALILRGTSAASAPSQLKGALVRQPSSLRPICAMDFSNASATQPLGGGVFRAHVQWKEK